MFFLQSLADIAREEAERRKGLDEQGIKARVITGNYIDADREGNLTTFEVPGGSGERKKPPHEPEENQPSNRTIRVQLQKLDQTIQNEQEKLNLLRERLRQERWELSGSKKASRKKDSASRLEAEINALELKLKKLRNERRKIYDAGRKSGFLPGELEGKGIIP